MANNAEKTNTVDFNPVKDQSTGVTQAEGHAKAIQGAAEQAFANILPESHAQREWKAAGEAHQSLGEKETAYAKQRQLAEATIDSAAAKVKSAVGYVTGNQQQQTEGNIAAEKASWEFKQAHSTNPVAPPVPSLEGITGKIESAVGYLIGDQETQKDGNLKSEKAAWRDGV